MFAAELWQNYEFLLNCQKIAKFAVINSKNNEYIGYSALRYIGPAVARSCVLYIGSCEGDALHSICDSGVGDYHICADV